MRIFKNLNYFKCVRESYFAVLCLAIMRGGYFLKVMNGMKPSIVPKSHRYIFDMLY